MIPLWRRRIYADWAATTPLHPQVARAMRRAERLWANPSAIYSEGAEAKRALDRERASVARTLGVKPEEVYFTSGGTEANATIIEGAIRTRLEAGIPPERIHAVSTSIEHSSVLEALRRFEARGVRVAYVEPGADGIVRADDVISAITNDTALVTCMYANNETGAIMPVSRIGAEIRKMRDRGARSPLVFHIDASQAPLWLSCELEGLRADAITLDAHKMQGPKGVGALIVRRHARFAPLMAGGGQERGKRPTTEALSLIAGFAEALQIAALGREARSRRARAIRDEFLSEIGESLPAAVVNGSLDKRLPNNVNISLPGVSDPEFAVLKLDAKGIACSTKSSCLRGEEESYVAAAIERAAARKESREPRPWRARNTLRFALAPTATRRDVLHIVRTLQGL